MPTNLRFWQGNDKDNRETYAIAMKYFIIFTLLAFLAVMGYINILRHIISRYYWEGLKVVPIVMAGMIMMGIYFNLSFWYKLIDKPIWGAYFSGIGCSVLILINIIFVPQYSYMALCVGWSHWICNGNDALLLCRTKEIPYQLPLKKHRNIRSYDCNLLHCHHL